MYGRTASQLLRDLNSADGENLQPFNADAFDQVMAECENHHQTLQSLIRKMEEAPEDAHKAKNEDHFGAVIHHLSLLRNKRCLMAYTYNRAGVIQGLRWKVGAKLPEEIMQKLSFSEKEYFKSHSAAIESCMSELDLDLTVDMVPPKDPYIQVRVLDHIGDNLSLGDHTFSLTRNSVHSVRRTDAEQYISQGLMEEFFP
ncbi:partner of SLD five 1 [Wolffia australiana]